MPPVSIPEVIMEFRKSIYHCTLSNALNLILFLASLVLLIGIPLTPQAQTAGEGTISGTVDVNAFATPANVSTTSTPQYLIGNAPRTRALNLNNPCTQNLYTSVRRSFSLPHETSFVFEVDCLNTWNKATFAPPNQSWAAGSTTFGTITGMASTYAPRDYQFAAHIKF
jgi:hypothetical protein